MEWGEGEQQPLPETERITTPKFIKSSVDTKATTDIPRVSIVTGPAVSAVPTGTTSTDNIAASTTTAAARLPTRLGCPNRDHSCTREP